MNDSYEKTARAALLLVPLAILLALNAPAAKAQGIDDATGRAKRSREPMRSSAARRARSRKAGARRRASSLDVAVGLQTKAWSSYESQRLPHGPQAHRRSARGGVARHRARAVGPAIRAEQHQGGRGNARTPREAPRPDDRERRSGRAGDEAHGAGPESPREIAPQRAAAPLPARFQARRQRARSRGESRGAHQKHARSQGSGRAQARAPREAHRARPRAAPARPARRRARDQIAIAEGQIEKARELLDAGRYREAKQAIERCEKTLRNSVRLMPLAPAGDPQNRLEEAHRLLERAGEIASGNGRTGRSEDARGHRSGARR